MYSSDYVILSYFYRKLILFLLNLILQNGVISLESNTPNSIKTYWSRHNKTTYYLTESRLQTLCFIC